MFKLLWFWLLIFFYDGFFSCSLSLSLSLSLSFKVGKYTTTAEGIEAEPHPLWEYPTYPRSEITELLTFDLTVGVPEKAMLKNEGEIALSDLNKPCHGVALWMEYRLTDARTVSGGLVKVRERGRGGESERERERCMMYLWLYL